MRPFEMSFRASVSSATVRTCPGGNAGGDGGNDQHEGEGDHQGPETKKNIARDKNSW